MKKRNLLRMFVAAFLTLVCILNVKAANTYVDAASCEGGVVYTNYYFFLDASPKMTTDYTTIGYYQNKVADSNLQSIANKYGIFSEEFAQSANRGYGVVPIDTENANLGLSVEGVGIRTFYEYMINIDTKVKKYNAYLVEHNWSRVRNQVVNEISSETIDFAESDISRMINATIILKKYPTISPIVNLADGDHPVQIQINRKYSQGTLKNISKIKPITIVNGNKTWDAYLQPALLYVQYCSKTSRREIEIIYYEPNAGKDTVTNLPSNRAFDVGSYGYVASEVPVRDGYTFLGWSKNPNAIDGDPDYSAGKKVYTSTTLYAIWKKNEAPISSTYSVIYRANTTDTVNNMPASITKNVGETVKISEEIPTRAGYTFLGWSSVSGATTIEEKYDGGSTYKDGKDLILYAVWKKKSSGNIIVNPATGVEGYIIPFSGVVTASFISLRVLKKKKSFMQF